MKQTYRSLGVSVGIFVALTLVGVFVVSLIPAVPGAIDAAAATLVGVAAGYRAGRVAVVVDPSGVLIRGVFRTRRVPWSEVAAVVVGNPDVPASQSVSLRLHHGTAVALHALDEPAVPWLRRWNHYRGAETLRQWSADYGVAVER